MIYSGTIQSKTNDMVPLFNDGKPMHSKYNPTGEAASFAQDIETGFIVVAGIGGGFHLASLLERLKGDFFVLAVESDKDSLDFCLGLEKNKEIFASSKIEACTVESLEKSLMEHYFPAAYPGFSFIPQRAWEIHNEVQCLEIKRMIEKKLKEISADFSVQSHFGKIWQRNILLNIPRINKKNIPSFDFSQKIAAIIAAGPSLDESVLEIKKSRDSYCVFSTDTAYGSLIKNGIIPEYVVSIDGQFISSSHFFCCNGNGSKETCFVFDLCANPSAVKAVRDRGFGTFFTKSLHPLCSRLLDFDTLPTLENGSGTVTIAACDLARQLGAKKIRVFGADFSYNNGKPYCKGTYLETNFSSECTKLENLETRYTNLMYRTELYDAPNRNFMGDHLKNPRSSEILDGYKETLIAWTRKYCYVIADNLLVNPKNIGTISAPNETNIRFHQLMKELDFIFLDNANGMDTSALLKNMDIYALIPYVAWLRKKDGNDKHSFFDLLKLAYYQLSRYTKLYEK